MENLKYRLYGLVAVSVVGLISFVSCSSDDSPTNSNQDPVYVYMAQSKESPIERELTYTSDKVQELLYNAMLEKLIETKSSVSFEVDPSLVDKFNTENDSSLQVLPEESYEMGKKELIIEAGAMESENSTIEIIAKDNLESGTNYLLPLSMTVKEGPLRVRESLTTAYYVITEEKEDGEGGEGETQPLYDKSDWSIHDFSSEDPDHNQFAENVIDGDDGTLWQGYFGDEGNEPLPHWVSVNMKKTYTVHGLKINPKHSNEKSLPSKIKVEFSTDGENWTDEKVWNTPWLWPEGGEDAFEVKRMDIPSPVEAQYFKVTILEDFGDVPVTGLYEIDVY